MADDLHDAVAQSPGPPSLAPVRRRRLWLFRGAALLLGLLPFVLIEIMLRALGAGMDTALVVPVAGQPGWYQLNSAFDQPYYGREELHGPEVRPFQLPKPDRTRRILVVGASTVIGFPFASELAFPRILEARLQAHLPAGDDVEVLNAGITAISSTVEVDVVAQGLAADPDLIVVYSGHNEFYGPGGSASTVGTLSPGWFRFCASLRRFRMVQMCQRLIRGHPDREGLLTTLPSDLRIRRDSSTYHAAKTRFEANLRRMVDLAQTAGVPILLVAPVSNEGSQPPLEPLQPSVADTLRDRFEKAEWQLKWGDVGLAITELNELVKLLPGEARVSYRLAQALERTGEPEQARAMFRRARDSDGCRFRAPAELQDAVLKVADSYRSPNVMSLDLHPILSAADPRGLPARLHFLEHVHFTWEGNVAVGSAIAAKIERDWRQFPSTDRRIADSTAIADQMGLQDEDQLAALALTMIVYQKPPFNGGADVEELVADLAADSVAVFRRLGPSRSRLFAELPTSRMYPSLAEGMFQQARAEGDVENTELWLKVMKLRR